MKKASIFLLFFISIIFCASSKVWANPVYIVIHGTWAINSSWYMPGGDFFDALEASANKRGGRVLTFSWSGKNHVDSRMQAARCLVKLIQSYPESMRIIVVAHSHGANVGILASQLLGQENNNQRKIEQFYALGCPVHEGSYMPDMNVIQYFYNLFSFEDQVQQVVGLFTREYPAHERIANLSVTVDGVQPGHSELHHAVIGRWLLGLHAQPQDMHSAACLMGNFHNMSMQQSGSTYGYTDLQQREQSQESQSHSQSQTSTSLQSHIGVDVIAGSSLKAGVFGRPGIVHFYTEKAPEYAFDADRDKLLARDAAINQMLLHTFLKSKSEYADNRRLNGID